MTSFSIDFSNSGYGSDPRISITGHAEGDLLLVLGAMRSADGYVEYSVRDDNSSVYQQAVLKDNELGDTSSRCSCRWEWRKIVAGDVGSSFQVRLNLAAAGGNHFLCTWLIKPDAAYDFYNDNNQAGGYNASTGSGVAGNSIDNVNSGDTGLIQGTDILELAAGYSRIGDVPDGIWSFDAPYNNVVAPYYNDRTHNRNQTRAWIAMLGGGAAGTVGNKNSIVDGLGDSQVAEAEGINSMLTWTDGPPAPPSGGSVLKYYDGATWQAKPLKVYNGTTWDVADLKFYNGSDWI